MGQNLEDILKAKLKEAERWHADRARTVANAANLEARGRQVYADAIRTGRPVLARTLQELRALGEAANVGVRSAANAATLGYADNLSAGVNAGLGVGGSGGFKRRYERNLAQEHQWDREGAQRHPMAARTGEILGTIGGIAVAEAPMAGRVVVAKLFPGVGRAVRAVERTKRIGFIAEGLGTMAAVGGGGVGAATQLASDAASGRKTSGSDLTGALVGGAVGGLQAVRRGPVLGAAIGGALTTAVQDGAQGNVSLDDISRNTVASAYAGRALGALGSYGSNALPRALKGQLGERLTIAKSYARGETVPLKPVPRPLPPRAYPRLDDAERGLQSGVDLSRGHTVTDAITDWQRALEAKFGAYASPTSAQKRAIKELGPRYLPDHWLPSDVGKFAASWFGPAAGQLWADEEASY